MSKCAHLREQFSAYLDGAVTGAVMHEIAAHLEVCSGCSAEFAQWRNAQSLVSSIGPAKAPENLALRLRVALSQQMANTDRGEIRSRKSSLAKHHAAPDVAGYSRLRQHGRDAGAVALLIGMFAPEPLLARDEPLGMASSPRFLYTSLSLLKASPTVTTRWWFRLSSTAKAGSTTTKSSPATRIIRPVPN